MALEHAWRRLGGNWAWGTSVFGVARKLEVLSKQGWAGGQACLGAVTG